MLRKIRFRLVFNRSNRLNKRNEGLIQIEAQKYKQKIYFSTHTYVKQGEFNNGVVTKKGCPGLNYGLYKMIEEIEAIELEYMKNDVDCTLAMLKDAVKLKMSPSAKFYEFGKEVIAESDRCNLTKQNYTTFFNSIEKFKSGLLVTDIDYHIITSYDKWLVNSGIAHNTRVSRLRLMRAVLNEAVKRDIIKSNPFDKFKIPQMNAKKGYVTKEQLERLETLILKGEEKITRDAFLIGCYTGLRFSDIIKLRDNNISNGWLTIKMQKTKSVVEIPINDLFEGKFLKLCESYGNINKLTTKILINSKTNKILKNIFESVGIPKVITFHSSRHTFATLLGQQGVSIEIISKLLGHKKLQTTQIYREIDKKSIELSLSKTS